MSRCNGFRLYVGLGKLVLLLGVVGLVMEMHTGPLRLLGRCATIALLPQSALNSLGGLNHLYCEELSDFSGNHLTQR